MKQKSILVVCPNPENAAPSQRLKYEQYFDYFRSQGFEVSVSAFKTKRFWNIVYSKGNITEKIFWTLNGYVKRALYIPLLPFYDVIYIHLDVTPFGGAFFERIYVAMNANVVYDIDDLVFLKDKSKVNLLTSYIKSAGKYFYLFKHAKQVIVCTPYLEEFAKKYSDNVTDISSTINTSTYLPVNTYNNDKPLTIGWSGSHSTLKYFLLLKEILVEIKKIRNVHLLIFGVVPFEIDGLDAEVIPFHEQAEIPTLQRIDIGLYPLPLDEQWVFGKSGLKALQYMALGIPTIATSIGANLRIIHHETTGLLVTTKEEWLNAILTLIDHPDMRRRIGMSGRENVVNKYSIDANKDLYLSVLKNVVIQ